MCTKFIVVKNDGATAPGAWNLFQQWLSKEKICAEEFAKPNDFERCIGQYGADNWVAGETEFSLHAAETLYNDAVNNIAYYRNCYAFEYHDGFVLFYAKDEGGLIESLNAKITEMLANFGKEIVDRKYAPQ